MAKKKTELQLLKEVVRAIANDTKLHHRERNAALHNVSLYSKDILRRRKQKGEVKQ